MLLFTGKLYHSSFCKNSYFCAAYPMNVMNNVILTGMCNIYETPNFAIIEVVSEGVLCMSSSFETWEEEDVI